MSTDAYDVYELRQYTLQPGSFEEFAQLFDDELLAPQDAVGMKVLGQFRDLDRPDMFVWIRAFTDMQTRHDALADFYGGPVWAKHRETANAMMIDSDDVLLLTPSNTEIGLVEQMGELQSSPDLFNSGTVFFGTVSELLIEQTDAYVNQFRSVVTPLIRERGGRPLTTLVSLHATNTFPRLPVREGINVAFTLSALSDLATLDVMNADPIFKVAQSELDALAQGRVHQLRLAPTSQSALH